MADKESEDRASGKDTPFGPSGAKPRPGTERNKDSNDLDRPATPDEDTATDERRDKPIRGFEDLDD